MKKHFRYGLFFALGAMLALGFVACGDESSSGPSKNEESGIETEVSSSSENDEAISSSSDKDEKSSSSKKVESSSSTEASSSSTKIENSSSSVNVKESSSSSKVESSSGKDDVSSSSQNVQSSSSGKPVESSSSKAKSSSSEISSSSVKPAESSSSESSSSVKLVESSSSKESSSSLNQVESSSSEMSSSSTSSSSALMSIYDAENNTLTDLRDNHIYKTVTIGTQVWMAQNIDYLPKDTVGTKYGGNTVCGGGTTGTFNEGDCSIHGRLYTREVLIDPIGDGRVICPDGWIVPTLTHWNVLIEYLGGASVAGKKMKLDDNSMWGENMEHSNESGFSATLAGYYTIFNGFNDVTDTYKRTSMLVYPVDNSLYSDEIKTKTIYDDEDTLRDLKYHGPQYAISVRCIKK